MTAGFLRDEAAAAKEARLRQARRLCFFAHYHPAGIVADCVLHYLSELRESGFSVVVASTAAFAEGEADKLRSACDDLILRENQGFDFGGWIDCWRKWTPFEAELLLLCNDSVYGPIGSLADCIERLCSTPADFYGCVGSDQIKRHVQSWFLLLRPAAYRSAAFERLFSKPVPAHLGKAEIIRRYEVGLTVTLEQEGLRSHCFYEPARDALISRMIPFNPCHLLWKELVTELGIPFIKVELLRDNPLSIGDLKGWPEIVVVRRPELVEAIATDIASRRRVTRQPVKSGGGAIRALRVLYWRWLRKSLARNFRYPRSDPA